MLLYKLYNVTMLLYKLYNATMLLYFLNSVTNDGKAIRFLQLAKFEVENYFIN